ncbi:UvrB/UvrC motif-containing protein [Acetivibrio ethanolgignens]|uniref:UVR domain-containing protein n=1 Tax=Acetivibrio ethanolgignens TaxID=290052 RepID=A0A0V8QHI6_9FIRM|nr:UvrB/UvrC motif-containing protein [Acetivibrio ethanolgignens]KSV60033.1 hypothetical protein ASU35_07080 [Acetivibrio ethanolgignens]
MLCDKCHKREAKVYYTEIINGEKKEQYLCEECAAKYTSFQIEKASSDSGLGGLLSSILSNYYGEKSKAPASKEATMVCKSCGITYQEVLEAGKLGCADCYKSFGEMIERTLRQIQGADTHIGKSPTAFCGEVKKEKRIKKEPPKKEPDMLEKLSFQLQQAIEREEFEEAARLRDEIRALKKEVRDA